MRKLKWILIFVGAFLCMMLTACAIRSVAMNQTQLSRKLPITPSEIIVIPANDCNTPSCEYNNEHFDALVSRPSENTDSSQATTPKQTDSEIPSTSVSVETVTTENHTDPLPITTEKPITIPDHTTAPVTTQKPSTTAPVTTQKPSTTAPVTTQKPVINQNPTDTDRFWFDDVVFLGDSITAGLEIYAKNGVLGDAAFVATPSYSVMAAISSVAESNPNVYYNGVAMRPEDCIAQTGKSKVYIMLGINDLGFGVDSTINRYRQLIANIQEKNPHVTIYIQSITPITSTSSITNQYLNNDNVKRYNQKLKALCQELGLTYVDVASVMYDDEGIAFRREFCRDADVMGVHYNNAGYACWVEYLLTHTDASDDEV